MYSRQERSVTLWQLFIVFSALSLFSSCINTRKATIFPDAYNGVIASNTPMPENLIQKNDILHIKISSLNPEASSSFNTYTPGGSDDQVAGHLVSTDGTIQLPFLGIIPAEGKTKDQLREMIIERILEMKLLKDPVVVVRFMNFRVTVLGEVNHPSVVSVPNEKISLLEAIGLAGDITIYGKKDNVLVIREENNKRITQRINLNSNEIFTSPYYYLKSGDIVYVEPSKARVASAGRSNQWLPILFSGLSLVAIVADRVLN